MNKLLLFPLGFMFLMSLIVTQITQQTYTGIGPDLQPSGQLNITGHDSTNGSVNIPNAGSHSFSINTVASIMVIMVTALALSIIGGIHFLGSGLSEFSNKQIFTAMLFLGMWAAMTVISSQVIFNIISIVTMLWVVLTLMFITGLGIHMTSPVME